jgi:hypothetical protein
MPTVPYAKALVSVNAAATTSGGVVVPGAATIAFTGENTAQWSAQRWEIYSYPSDFTAPAGWSTDASGVIFSTAVAPSSFALPALAAATGWGKYMVRLTVNGGLTGGKADATLIDESTALRMTSTRGLRGLGFNETTQFGGAREQYAAELNAALRAIEAFTAGGGGGTPWHNVPAVEKLISYTVLSTDYLVVFTGASGGVVFTLPATPTAGDTYVVSNQGSVACTVAGNGNTILGATTFALAVNQSITLTKSISGIWVIQ